MQKHFLLLSLLLLVIESKSSYAQTAEEIAAAHAKAEYLALLKQNAEAERVIADTEKAQADAEKSKIDAQKSAFPTPLDPTKYKVATVPSQPAVNATALTMMDESIESISKLVSERIQVALNRSASCKKQMSGRSPRKAVIFPDEVNVRSLMRTYRTVNAKLQAISTNIYVSRTMLRDAITPGLFSAPIGPAAISSFAELAVSYAATLKSQYGWSNVSEKSNAEKAFRWSLYSALGDSALIVQPNMLMREISQKQGTEEEPALSAGPTETTSMQAMGPSPSAPQPLADPRSNSRIKIDDELGARQRNIDETLAEIEDSQLKGLQELRTATEVVSDIRAKAKSYAALSNKERNDWIKKINAAAAQLKTVLDETTRALGDLSTVPQGGISALEAAAQGDLVEYALARGCVYRLATEVVDSSVDVLAKDGLLRGLRVSAAQATMVRWTLYNTHGVIVSTGVVNHKVGMKKVDISDQP